MDPKRFITEVKEITENGEAVIILPDELINELGWKEGDVLDFEVVNDAIIIRNLTKENNERCDDYTPSNG